MNPMRLARGPSLNRLILLTLSLLFVECKKESSGPSGPDSGGSGGTIATGSSVPAGSGVIASGGGSFTVVKPGAPIDGLQVEFPSGAYAESRTVEVSYEPILGHQLGGNFNPLTPLITISNGGGYSQAPMTVKIPAKIPAGHFAMVFLYDDATGELEGVPMIASDSTSLTIATRNFSFSSSSATGGFSKALSPSASRRSTFVASSIVESDLASGLDTGFRPGVDDWGFPNYGSYLAPGGHCAGQSFGALWYYKEKKRKGSPSLWMRFDNSGDAPKTPDVWQDDVPGYRFCSVLQDDENWLTMSDLILDVLQSKNVGDVVTWNLFAYSMLLTKRPQLVGVWGTSNGKTVGHAIIVYGKALGQLYVCDPNFPGDLNRRISRTGTQIDPYYSGPTASETGTPYKWIYYLSATSMFDWYSTDSRWQEVIGKTIGSDKFPDYTVKVLNDNVEFVPLTDGFTKEDGHFSINVEGSGFLARFEAFDETGANVATDAPFDLTRGKHRLGICAYDKGMHWVGFRWFSVTAGGDTGLIPLAIENSWTYERKEFSSDGTLLSTIPDVTTLTKDTLANGQRWFLAVETVGGVSASAFLANRADGVWYWFPYVPGGVTFLGYKYPARPGDTFQSGLDGKTTVTLKDTAATTNTPSGAFSHCYLYESKTEGRTGVTQVWISPGLGPVGETDLKPYPGGGTYIAMRKGLTGYILH